VVILWLVIIELLAVAAYPLVRKIFSGLPDKGWGLSKIIGVLTLAFGAWAIAFTHIFSFSKPLITSLFLIFLGVSAYVIYKRRKEIFAEIKEKWVNYLVSEIIFLVVFGFFLLIRVFSADIFGAEKFMDFAFLNSLARFDAFPPADPWLSSGTINYYYFGYFTWASLAKLTSIAPSIVYNLAAVTIPALVAQGIFSLGFALTKKYFWAIAGVVMALFLGNLAGSMQIFGRGLAIFPYNYWEPTRVISGTINEFPFFTSIWADLHPHFMAMPNFVLFLGFLWVLAHNRTKLVILLAGISVGIAYATSGWDAPTMLFLAFVILAAFSGKEKWTQKISSAILPLLAIIGIGIATALPLISSYTFPKMNMGLASVRSDLWQFVLVFGLFLFMIVGAFLLKPFRVLENIKKHKIDLIAIGAGVIIFAGLITQNLVVPLLLLLLALGIMSYFSLETKEQKFAFLLAICGLIVALSVELFFVDDTYGPANQRLNTVFKFHLHSWYLFALAGTVLIPLVWSTLKEKRILRYGFAGALGILVILSAIYPIGATVERAGKFAGSPKLDGTEYLKNSAPDDAEAIKWLQDNVDDRSTVIVEATGNPYGSLSRVSAYTGIKTILGWGNHERLWRRDEKSGQEITKRSADVKTIYEETDAEKTKSLLAQYNVKYVYVSNQEKTEYPNGDFEKFATIGKAVFDKGTVKIYKISL